MRVAFLRNLEAGIRRKSRSWQGEEVWGRGPPVEAALHPSAEGRKDFDGFVE